MKIKLILSLLTIAATSACTRIGDTAANAEHKVKRTKEEIRVIKNQKAWNLLGMKAGERDRQAEFDVQIAAGYVQLEKAAKDAEKLRTEKDLKGF